MEQNPVEEKHNLNANSQIPEEEEKLTPRQIRARKREETLDKIFGTYRPSNFENIWGKKLAIFGFFLMVAMSIFAYWGTKKGLITWDKKPEEMPSWLRAIQAKKDMNKDTLNLNSIDNKDTKKD